jgi:gluconolactonase
MRKHPIMIFLWIIIAVATIDRAQETSPVVRLDPVLNDIVPSGVKVEKLAGDFRFLEGPVWVRKAGYLLFSDIPGNVINKWNPADGKVSVFLDRSGFTGTDPSGLGGEQTNGRDTFYTFGSNGITLDHQARIVFCAHGDRQVVRLEKDGQRTILASQYEGKRLNSPNDLVYKSDGSLYFTDPPAGLRERDRDPKKELPFNGVYLLKNGKLQLLTKDLPSPNGLAFSLGEKYLYIDDSLKGIIMRYEVRPDDTIANGQLFIDMSSDLANGVPDGMKVDQKGNVYSAGPRGLWIMSPKGKHLGTLLTPERLANLAFGDADGKTLYLTARSGLYRVHLKIPGKRP